ncbi:MAG TPA: T9SS type A sorting domain-containing protein, partial [Cyclobacteriaceae bacterium]
QKKDNGIVQFIDQIENTASHLFDFDLDYRDYTLYFIPDRTAFPDHLPTVFGKTLMLEESSYFHLRDDSTVVMKVLKVSPPASGSSFISGTISQGNPGGRMRAAGVTSVTVILLDAQGNPVGITTSDETGYFIFENLAPGEYQLAVTADPDQPIAHEPYQVDISTANARVELTLSEEGISGSTERVLYIQSISFDALDAKTFGDDPFQLEATSSSGLPVTYSSSNTDIAVVDGAQVTILHAGTVAITATQAGNESYETVEFTQDLVIHKASQTIDFEMISDKASDEISFELSALASSGLQVSYASSNTSIVLIEEATAFILGSGEVSVTASQNGNENYNAAEPVVQTFTVNLVLSVENPTSKAKIYPNPASNIIKINSEYSISSVSIIHSSGAKEEVELKENSFSIQHLAVGIYILRFNEGGMLHHLKVVKN